MTTRTSFGLVIAVAGAAACGWFVLSTDVRAAWGGSILLGIAALVTPGAWAAIASGVFGVAVAGAAIYRAHSARLNPLEWGGVSLTMLLLVVCCWAASALWRRGWRVSGFALASVSVVVAFVFANGCRTQLGPTVVQSSYVMASGGVRLAVDQYLRRGSEGERRPAIVLFTRYHRATSFLPPFGLLFGGAPRSFEQFVEAGYAYVVVDVRGTGASFGVQSAPFSVDEIQDSIAVVDWIVTQPWSNGVVGARGISYSGTSAELLGATHHPAVKAVEIDFGFYDRYLDVTFPGGIQATGFTSRWQAANDALDRNQLVPDANWFTRLIWRGVRRVDGDDGTALRAAVAQHSGNVDVHDALVAMPFRDDRVFGQVQFTDTSPYLYQSRFRESGLPVLIVSGWFDAGVVHGAIKRLLTEPTPGVKAVIGPWDHGGFRNVSPCGEVAGQPRPLVENGLSFFDHALRGLDNGYEKQPKLRYFTMCGDGWKATDSWPVAGTTPTVFYLGQDGSLVPRAPSAADASDRYSVDLAAGTGPTSRWAGLAQNPADPFPVGYTDRFVTDRVLPNYTTAWLKSDTEVTGHPVVHLWVTSSATDGQFFAYLEDIGPEGSATYVTEGELRAVHRKLSADRPPYLTPVPYHSFLRKDAQPLQPGVPTELVIDLLPTSYLFKAGHAIRVTLAGADADNFAPIPGPAPMLGIRRDATHPSRIELPVVAPTPR